MNKYQVIYQTRKKKKIKNKINNTNMNNMIVEDQIHLIL